MTKYLATFHDIETNLTSLVFVSTHKSGGFAVALRDDDSGEIIPVAYIFETIEAAIDMARALPMPQPTFSSV